MRVLAGLGATFALWLALGLFAAGCGEPETPPAAGQPPAIVLSGVTLHHYRADGIEAQARSKEAIYFRDTGQLHAEQVRVDVLAGPQVGRGGLTLDAGSAEFAVSGERARAFHGVVARTGEGDEARTEEARYEEPSGLLFGEQPVVARGPGYALSADRYALSTLDQTLSLEGAVRVTASADGGAP